MPKRMTKAQAVKRLNEADRKIWAVLNALDTSYTGSAWKAGLVTASKKLTEMNNRLKKM